MRLPLLCPLALAKLTQHFRSASRVSAIPSLPTASFKAHRPLPSPGSHYAPSPDDPVYHGKAPASLLARHGFATNHSADSTLPPAETFGNLSIFSLNTHVASDLTAANQPTALTEVIDTDHPSILALQATSEETIEALESATPKHYAVAARTYFNTDIASRNKEFKPIFYDTKVLRVISEGGFQEANSQESYGTYALFQHIETGKQFVFINVDLFSLSGKRNAAELFVIFSSMKTSFARTMPIILAGSINETTPEIDTLFSTAFVDTLDMDKHNLHLPRVTVHNHKRWVDPKQRDFLLLTRATEREEGVFTVNLARILAGWRPKLFERYPQYAILTLPQQN